MSSGPQGPGWWRASDGRWYPPQAGQAPQQPASQPYTPYPAPSYRQSQPQQFSGAAFSGPGAIPPKKSNRNIWIVVLSILGVLLVVGVVGVWWIFRTVSDTVSSTIGGGKLDCPSGDEISDIVDSPVTGPTEAPLVIAAACYYLGDVEVIIASGSKIIADDEIASMIGEGEAAGAEARPVDVGEKGQVWASDVKSYAIAVGSDAVVSVEVQGKDFSSIPDKSDAAVAILEKVLR